MAGSKERKIVGRYVCEKRLKVLTHEHIWLNIHRLAGLSLLAQNDALLSSEQFAHKWKEIWVVCVCVAIAACLSIKKRTK